MKVLIADDDPVARRLLESFLKAWGVEVVSAADGAAAWQLFETQEFPIVITDWMMPAVDGLELIRRIRAHPQPAYVYAILLTALSQKADVVQGMEAGADDFLSKPFDRDELRVRFRQGERVIRLERSLAEQNRALRDAQAALLQKEQLASLGQLAAGVAHEINNPVAYVSNNISVLRRDVRGILDLLDAYHASHAALAQAAPAAAATIASKEQDIDLAFVRQAVPQLLDKTLDGLQRIRDIVRNLRDFARLDEAEFKDVDINAALTATTEVMGHELKERQITLRTDFHPLPPLPCQAGKINQVFLNVLRNAAQASPPGGLIELRTLAEADGSILVEIEDHGGGIRPEVLPHIFEPFFTTKPVGQGTGLGLSVSYGIVRDHGGTIAAESEPDRGSTFRIRLPLAKPDQQKHEG